MSDDYRNLLALLQSDPLHSDGDAFSIAAAVIEAGYRQTTTAQRHEEQK